MKNKTLYLVIALLAISCVVDIKAQKSEYQIAKTIKLTGDGWWDYLSVDEVNSKLFVSHGEQVNVVDLKTGEQIAVIPDTKGVHGIAIANDLNKAYISCGMDSTVSIISLDKFELLAKIYVTGKNPDAILYDKFSKKVFTFNGRSSNATVIDANTYQVLATIPLSGKPEFPQTDGKGKIFVNIEDKNSVSQINATTMVVEKTWSIAPGEEPSGLAFDAKNNRLFSVCGNKLMTVIDSKTGKLITTLPIGNGCDGVAFDPITKRIYSSNGEGTITVVQQISADKYKVVENFKTVPGARTITIDKTSHHIFLSAADREPGEGRTPAKPNSFRVIEIETVK